MFNVKLSYKLQFNAVRLYVICYIYVTYYSFKIPTQYLYIFKKDYTLNNVRQTHGN